LCRFPPLCRSDFHPTWSLARNSSSKESARKPLPIFLILPKGDRSRGGSGSRRTRLMMREALSEHVAEVARLIRRNSGEFRYESVQQQPAAIHSRRLVLCNGLETDCRASPSYRAAAMRRHPRASCAPG
jgi:hypothetical protein